MYFEIFKQGKLIKRGKTIIGGLSWDNEIMSIPTLDLTLPAEYAEFFDGREDVKIHVNDKVFWGHLRQNYTLDKNNETITLPLEHIVCEWEYRQISINHAVSDGNINVVFKGDKVRKNIGNQEGITACDFTLTTKQVKNKISDAKLIKKAYVQAWNLQSGDPVAITKVDRGKLKTAEDTYDITFSTAKGTQVTVECTVQSSVNVGGLRYKSNKADKEKITARRFSIDISSVDSLTDKALIRISQAKAWVYRKPSKKIGVRVKSNDIREEVGYYTVVFETVTGKTSVTIDVQVTDESLHSVLETAVVDELEDIYNDMNMAYPGWEIDWQDDSADRTIDYVYSRQNKLEALTKTMEITPDLFWRVGFTNEKKIEVGKFGEKKPYSISVKPSGISNRRMITEPEVTPDYENVINVATVYSEKNDGGMGTLTLREVYNDKELLKKGKIKELIQDEKFPVVILHANVNNERDYTQYITQYPKLAPNNEIEYAVIDTESVALESGTIIEGTFAFNDLGAFNTESKKVTDKKRIQAATTVYHAAIRKLIEARRNYRFEVTVEEMPPDVNVGDKIRVLYDNSIWNLDQCSSYWKKILQMSDYFYIERMTWDIDATGMETNQLTLVKYLKVDRETSNGI